MLKLAGTVLLFDRPDLNGQIFTAETYFGKKLESVPVYYPNDNQGPIIGEAQLIVLENRVDATVLIKDPEAESLISVLLPKIGGAIGGGIVTPQPPYITEGNVVMDFPVEALLLTVAPADPDSKLKAVLE